MNEAAKYHILAVEKTDKTSLKDILDNTHHIAAMETANLSKLMKIFFIFSDTTIILIQRQQKYNLSDANKNLLCVKEITDEP